MSVLRYEGSRVGSRVGLRGSIPASRLEEPLDPPWRWAPRLELRSGTRASLHAFAVQALPSSLSSGTGRRETLTTHAGTPARSSIAHGTDGCVRGRVSSPGVRAIPATVPPRPSRDTPEKVARPTARGLGADERSSVCSTFRKRPMCWALRSLFLGYTADSPRFIPARVRRPLPT